MSSPDLEGYTRYLVEHEGLNPELARERVNVFESRTSSANGSYSPPPLLDTDTYLRELGTAIQAAMDFEGTQPILVYSGDNLGTVPGRIKGDPDDLMS